MRMFKTTPFALETCDATPETEKHHLRTLTVATRMAWINSLMLQGRGAALTAITGIEIRLERQSVASTAGAAITPSPTDPGDTAADMTAFTGPTGGTAGANQLAIGCGAAGPGGWVAENPDAAIVLEANGAALGNVDLISICGVASLAFAYTLGHGE